MNSLDEWNDRMTAEHETMTSRPCNCWEHPVAPHSSHCCFADDSHCHCRHSHGHEGYCEVSP